jgi:hypothetical protein
MVLERSGATVLGRITGHDGQPITPASIAAIAVEVWDIETDPPGRIAGPTSLAAGSVVLASLTKDARWQEDDVGYNFRHELPAESFPDAKVYRVEYKLTPTAGAVFRIAYELEAVRMYGE